MRNRVNILLFTALLIIPLHASAQWPTNPEERLYIGNGIENAIISDGDGGAFVIWTSYYYQCYLQKLDRYGYPQFGYPLELEIGYGEHRVFLMVTDGMGGAIIVLREYNWESEDYKLGVFRYDHEGNAVYENVAPALPEPAPYLTYNVATDSLGGVYILYSITQDDLRIQHIGPSGERLWGDEAITLDIGSPSPYAFWLTMGADLNYCYATANGESIQRHAFKFTANGEAVWGPTGVAFSPLGEYNELAPDGTGGFVEICREGSTGSPLWAYRFDSGGNWVWDEGGINLGEMYWDKSVLCKYPEIFICWTTADYPYNSQLQKMDYQGNFMWQENLHIFSTYNSQGDLVMDNANGTGLLFGCRMMIPPEESSFFAQKYSYEGERLWSEDDVMIADGENVYLYSLYLYPNDSGGGLYSWEEIDPVWGQRICAAMVNSEGELGIVTGIKEVWNQSNQFTIDISIYPNPTNSASILKLPTSLPPMTSIEIRIFDILGRTVYNSHTTGERRVIPLNYFNQNSALIPNSMYIIEVSTEQTTWQEKVLFLK